MAKFTHPSKLEQEAREAILVRLCRALCSLKSPLESAQFLKDLLSPQEVEMIAKRLKIAELIIGGETYSEISAEMKVSHGTIARVNEWLKVSGEGYRMILERLPKEEGASRPEISNLPDIKKKYPVYYWPQILLENVVKSAKETDKRRLRSVLRSMDKKTALYKQLNNLL